MRTDDILALSNGPCAGHLRAFDRRSLVIGSILAAALIVMAWASAYSVRPVQAEAPDSDQSELSAFPQAVERSGTLSALPILF